MLKNLSIFKICKIVSVNARAFTKRNKGPSKIYSRSFQNYRLACRSSIGMKTKTPFFISKYTVEQMSGKNHKFSSPSKTKTPMEVASQGRIQEFWLGVDFFFKGIGFGDCLKVPSGSRGGGGPRKIKR